MNHSITISVTINPISRNDNSGGTVRVRIPLIDPDTGNLRDEGDLHTAALKRGCQKLYGKNTFWHPDSGLRGYGQVMRPCPTGGADAVTYRAALEIVIPKLSREHLAALDEQNEKTREMYSEMDRDYKLGLHAGQDGIPKPTHDDHYGEIAHGYRDGQQERAEMLTKYGNMGGE